MEFSPGRLILIFQISSDRIYIHMSWYSTILSWFDHWGSRHQLFRMSWSCSLWKSLSLPFMWCSLASICFPLLNLAKNVGYYFLNLALQTLSAFHWIICELEVCGIWIPGPGLLHAVWNNQDASEVNELLLVILDARNSTVIIVRTLFAEGFHFH